MLRQDQLDKEAIYKYADIGTSKKRKTKSKLRNIR